MQHKSIMYLVGCRWSGNQALQVLVGLAAPREHHRRWDDTTNFTGTNLILPQNSTSSSLNRGGVLTNGGQKNTVYTQTLVATRLLDIVHDRLAHLGRLQRVYPRRSFVTIRRRPPRSFQRGGRAGLLRCGARGLFVSIYDMRGGIIAFRHGF